MNEDFCFDVTVTMCMFSSLLGALTGFGMAVYFDYLIFNNYDVFLENPESLEGDDMNHFMGLVAVVQTLALPALASTVSAVLTVSCICACRKSIESTLIVDASSRGQLNWRQTFFGGLADKAINKMKNCCKPDMDEAEQMIKLL